VVDVTTRFSLELFSFFVMYNYMCLYVIVCLSMCILVGISGFLFKKGILVILDSGVFWSFDEKW